MKLKMSVNGIYSAKNVNPEVVIVDCYMSHNAMFDALKEFLKRISKPEWEDWKRKIDEDTE